MSFLVFLLHARDPPFCYLCFHFFTVVLLYNLTELIKLYPVLGSPASLLRKWLLGHSVVSFCSLRHHKESVLWQFNENTCSPLRKHLSLLTFKHMKSSTNKNWVGFFFLFTGGCKQRPDLLYQSLRFLNKQKNIYVIWGLQVLVYQHAVQGNNSHQIHQCNGRLKERQITSKETFYLCE